uniref:Ovule protein n=1 Tax=Parastrongyloides trichosuri TaxID=131310 RepID=A0A0N5A234_PARTI
LNGENYGYFYSKIVLFNMYIKLYCNFYFFLSILTSST